MKRLLFLIACSFSLLETASAQTPPSACPNLDFETGTFTNWTGQLGTCCPINLTGGNQIVSGRQTIMSGNGFDPNTGGNNIPVVAPGGGNFSVRLGNEQVGSQAEMLSYTMTVGPQSDLFIYRYAVVLQDPNHGLSEQPRFQIRTYVNGVLISPCGVYDVVASANIPGFTNYQDIRWKNWTTVGIDLSPYMGQSVTIEFKTGDCALGAHFGYAYIDCSCGPLQINNAFCPGATNDTLRAPEGFQSYLWSTGATTPTIVVPSANVGQIYSVTLTSVTGCTVTLSTTIAQTSITAGFEVTSNCQSLAVFSDTTTAQNGIPVGWHWDFGDGNTSVIPSPTNVYQNPGLYNVQLITTSNAGCNDTVTGQVSIWPSPVTLPSVGDVCEGLPSVFNDSTVIAWGNITNWNWSFSDGTTSTQQYPSHTFPGSGNYSANLVVTSDLGCTDTADINFTIYPALPINAGQDFSFCGGQVITIGDPNNPGLAYEWTPNQNLQDPHTAVTFLTVPNPVNSVETYQYLLTGIDTVSGCVSKDSMTIEAKAIPVANFASPPYQCFKGNSFDVFADTTYLGTNYNWDFGPSASPSAANTQIVGGLHYAAPGQYPILLIVDNSGCIDSSFGMISVIQEPEIALTVNEQDCPPLLVNFQSHITPPGPVEYLWTFDNITSTDSTPSHLFTIPGQYGVSLSVKNPEGCTDFISLSNVINVMPKPESRFATEPNVASILEPHFSFMNLSQNGYTLLWDFGDNTTSTDSNAVHTYQDTGIYFVSLIMEDAFGCRDTSTSPLRVEPYFQFYVPNAFTPNDDGVNDSFRGLGVYVKTYNMWIYNRWGEIVYYTSHYDRPWDGKGPNSVTAQNEVYEYLIRVTDSKDREHEYIGHVTLVR